MIRLGNFNVVLDACVLYDSLIRDFLLMMADKELYQPVWSPIICEEVKRNLISQANIKEDKAQRLITIINEAFPEAMLINQIDNLSFNNTSINEKDRHVVITAICSNSQVIVTYNIKDFPNDILKQFSIEAQTPDEFLLNILHLSFKKVLDIYSDMEAKYKNPPISREELLKRLKSRVPNFTSSITPYLDGSITRLY